MAVHRQLIRLHHEIDFFFESSSHALIVGAVVNCRADSEAAYLASDFDDRIRDLLKLFFAHAEQLARASGASNLQQDIAEGGVARFCLLVSRGWYRGFLLSCPTIAVGAGRAHFNCGGGILSGLK